VDNTRIGHYTIVSELGRGGMGVVYKAHEESLNRFVAIKVLGEQLASEATFVTRFLREARAAAALNHPNIVQIYFVGEDAGRHFFVMEYVSGGSLLGLVRKNGPLPPTAAMRFMLQAAHGLAAAHDVGMIHRDVKPANLMVDDRGLLKIADFGLALPPDAMTRLTTSGMLVGTPGYLSPEQCRGEKADARSDIYSLGVTFFEILTGRLPFQADSPLALLRMILDEEPPDVATLATEVGDKVRAIVHRMLAKDRSLRYQDCHTLASDLEAVLIEQGVHSVGPGLTAAPVASAVPPGPPDAAAPGTATPPIDGATHATMPLASESRVRQATPPPPPAAEAAPGAALVAAPNQVVAAPATAHRSRRGLVVALALLLVVVAGAVAAVALLLRSPAVKRLLPGRTEVAQAPAAAGGNARPGISHESLPEERPAVKPPATTSSSVVAGEPAGAAERRGERRTAAGPDAARVPLAGTAPDAGRSGGVARRDTGSDRRTATSSGRVGAAAAPGVASRPGSESASPLRGVVVVGAGESGLAGMVATDLVEELTSAGMEATDASAVPAFEGLVGDGGTSRLSDLLAAARAAGVATLVVARVSAAGERELEYMGRSDVAYRSRVIVTCLDVATRRSRGAPLSVELEYTSLNRAQVVERDLVETGQALVEHLR
jgi:eukaryotic-like serine/threonine-protein kinase